MAMELRGARVLVTGGARRVGAAIVRAFAGAGARVAIHCFQSQGEAAALAAALGGAEAGHAVLPEDLLAAGAPERLMAMAAPVDILVNNASLFIPRPLADEDPEDARRQFDLNFWVPLRLTRLLAARRAAAPGPLPGVAINILDSRVSAPLGVRDGSYGLSKKALAEATLACAAQFAPALRVVGVAPGAVLPPAWLPDSPMAKERAATPTRRLATPEDVAGACLFLATSQAANGTILHLDGGARLAPCARPAAEEVEPAGGSGQSTPSDAARASTTTI